MTLTFRALPGPRPMEHHILLGDAQVANAVVLFADACLERKPAPPVDPRLLGLGRAITPPPRRPSWWRRILGRKA